METMLSVRRKTKMKKYKLEIVGIQPVIWNVLKREIELEKKALKKDQLSEWEEDRENWLKKAEYNNEGQIIVPERWLKSAFIDACKKTMIVPHFATRKNQTYTSYAQSMMVFNTMDVTYSPDDIVDFGAFVGAQGKNSSTKVWRVRPMLKEWTSTFSIIDPIGRMDKDEMTKILEYAGLMVGIGDNRVNNFGRFEIKKLTEVESK